MATITCYDVRHGGIDAASMWVIWLFHLCCFPSLLVFLSYVVCCLHVFLLCSLFFFPVPLALLLVVDFARWFVSLLILHSHSCSVSFLCTLSFCLFLLHSCILSLSDLLTTFFSSCRATPFSTSLLHGLLSLRVWHRFPTPGDKISIGSKSHLVSCMCVVPFFPFVF